MTMHPCLHGLPLETLQQIAGYLADSHQPSLYALSLTSKTCHRATLLFIFRQIHLPIRNREDLQRDVNALTESLSRTDSARHVHGLSLKGYLDLNKPRNESGRLHNIDPLGWWKSTLIDEPRINTIVPNKEPIHRGEYLVYDESVIERSSEEDLAWGPVIDLVRTLPLAKLVYDCPNQFPPSLLDTLHRHNPQCKLHHLRFRLRTLLWGIPYPYEMALATSSCLHAIKLSYSRRDSEGDDDFNLEAMMELVAGLAPNLKEVTVVELSPYLSTRFWRPRGEWQGLPGFVSSRMIGSLTSLSLLGSVNLRTPELIRTWARYTDFSSLVYLALGGEGSNGGAADDVNGVNGEVMAWITQNCSFPQLKILHLVLERDTDINWRPDYSNNTASFFATLETLDELSVTGPFEPRILDAILYQHGRTIKKLNLHSSEHPHVDRSPQASRHEIPMIFTKEHILQIQAQCPVLEELAIPVKRTQSNRAETEIYKSFSKMRSLKSLFLILDCSEWRVIRDSNHRASTDHSFDKEDRTSWTGYIKKGHLRAALMNGAVDETLARSIWHTICQRKEGLKLESLKLWTTGGGEFGNGWKDLTHFFSNISRSWLIERLPQNNKDNINITELGRRARKTRDQENIEANRRRTIAMKRMEYDKPVKYITLEKWQANKAKYEQPFLEPTESELDAESDSEAMRVFRRIWARKKDSKDWRDDWSSLPLQD